MGSKSLDEELERIKASELKALLSRMSGKESGLTETGKPTDLSDATFKDFVEKNTVSVVDCWAAWCGPCRMVAPIVEELARTYTGKISFGKLDVDKNPQVPMQYGIMSIPTLLVFKKGSLVDRIVGAMPKPVLEKQITKHL